MIKIGNKAPAFKLKNSMGDDISLKDFFGKWVVLYFYPRDSTSGCTKEAIDFTELSNEFKKLNAEIIGVSPDNQESHGKFIVKYNLGVELLSDDKKSVMIKYDAWGLKKNYGKEYEGVIRTTVLITPEGKVAEIWRNVKVRIKRKTGEVRHVDVVKEKLLEFNNDK